MSHDPLPYELEANKAISELRYRNECLDLIRHYSNRGLPLHTRKVLHTCAYRENAKSVIIPYDIGTHIRLSALGYTVAPAPGHVALIPISTHSSDRDILEMGLAHYTTYRKFRKAFDEENCDIRACISWSSLPA